MITSFAKQQLTYALGSNISNNYIQTFAVGTGSQTIKSGLTTLTGSEFARFMITGSPNFSNSQVVSFQGDLNSVTASGLILNQFGNFTSGPINTGSAWALVQTTGSVVCDGTIELEVISTYTIN
jgi:hypothetical protein